MPRVKGRAGDYILVHAENARSYYLMRIQDTDLGGNVQTVIPPTFYVDETGDGTTVARHRDFLDVEPVPIRRFANARLVSRNDRVRTALTKFSEDYARTHPTDPATEQAGLSVNSAPRWDTATQARQSLYQVMTGAGVSRQQPFDGQSQMVSRAAPTRTAPARSVSPKPSASRPGSSGMGLGGAFASLGNRLRGGGSRSSADSRAAPPPADSARMDSGSRDSLSRDAGRMDSGSRAVERKSVEGRDAGGTSAPEMPSGGGKPVGIFQRLTGRMVRNNPNVGLKPGKTMSQDAPQSAPSKEPVGRESSSAGPASKESPAPRRGRGRSRGPSRRSEGRRSEGRGRSDRTKVNIKV